MSTEIPFRPLPMDQSDVRYLHGPDSTAHDGVPSGTVTELEWDASTLYPGTSRKFWNAEYDAFDDRYVRFLLEEIMPEVTARWSVTDDHARWGICGFSSGGNRALTAAWLRPDAFRRVISCLPSFPQMPGGNPYPTLIPQTRRKPLHVFLQAGHRDLGWNEPADNWLAETLRVAAALAEADYDFRLVLGDGGHDPNHGGVLLPDALRWVFRA